MALTQATAGTLYHLNLSQTAYVQVAPSEPAPPRYGRINLAGSPDGIDDPLLRKAIRSRKVVRCSELLHQTTSGGGSPNARSRLVVPMVRDRVCVGVIDLDSDEAEHFRQEDEDTVQAASVVALLLCEKEDTLNLLRELQAPVDYQQAFDRFLDDLMTLVAAASGMPFIALRELRDNSLHCLKSFGFTGITDEELSLSPLDDYPVFREAVADRKTVVEKDVTRDEIRSMLERLKLKDVKSFIVVPVLVGTDIFGTLSFAVSCEHEYTTLEKSGLEAIANTVGVAIANHRNFHLAKERVFEEAKMGAAITVVDVAQSARHEARNHLQNCQERLTLLASLDIGGTAKQRAQAQQVVDAISQELMDVTNAIQKIKTVTKPPERAKTAGAIEEIWREAFALVIGRLEQNNIHWNIQGTATTRIAQEYMRFAFLNMILNSVVAFKESKRKKGRRIDVTIDVQGERAKDIAIRYVDNATGIDPSRLKPAPNEGGRPVADIFLPGVTSKSEGSGYGMYLTRKILAEHGGTIDLKDHRSGVVFDIKLPKVE